MLLSNKITDTDAEALDRCGNVFKFLSKPGKLNIFPLNIDNI